MFAVGMPVDSPGGRGKLVGIVMGDATVSLDTGGFWSGAVAQISKIEETQVVTLVDTVAADDDFEIFEVSPDDGGAVEDVLTIEKLGDPYVEEPATQEEFETASEEIKEGPALLDLPKRMTKKWLEAQKRTALQQVLDAEGLTQARRKRIEDFLRGD